MTEEERMNEDKKLTYETYTIILKHSIFDGEQEHQVEEPLVVKQMTLLGTVPAGYIVNNMMDRMKHELLKRYGE